MKQLSGLDASFLYLETQQMPMHVGALHVFEWPGTTGLRRGSFAAALRKHITARLPILPVLRRRLWWMPLNLANPAWVDAEPDLRWHVFEHRLPAAARRGDGLPQLQAEVGRLHAQLLDRSRPLWRFHVLEGLAPGANGVRRVALYTQLHHAAVDGQAAVALANALLDVTPEPRAIELRPSKRPRTYRLEMAEMLRGVIGGQAQKVAQIIRELPATVGTLGSAAGQAAQRSGWFGLVQGAQGAAGRAGGNLALAPRTPFNASVTEGRTFAAVSLPLAELKALGREHEATLNDVVLWLCSSALRRYLAAHKALPKQSLVAAVPISLREKGDTSADNQASMSLVSLGTNIADPQRRLAHVKASTAKMKATMGSLKSVLPTDFPSLGVPWLMEAATALYGRAKVAERIPQLANVVISNVPGPAVPLYLAGARMLTNYPASIVVHGVALNITVQSYDRALDFGLIADAKAAPDVQALADAITVAMEDLRALPRPDEDNSEAGDGLAGTARKLARNVAGMVTQQALQGVLQGVVKTAMKTAMKGAMKGAVQDTMKGAVKGAVGAAVAGATNLTSLARAGAPKRKVKRG
jgi:WS/DGAT/MGAT family acyltransferase